MPARPSKDRRQAENRARRQARAARAANASRVPEPVTSRDSAAGDADEPAAPRSSRARAPRPARSSLFGGASLLGRARTDSRPGARAVRFAFVAALITVGITLFVEVKVDANGERLTTDEIEEAEDAGREVDEKPLYTTLDLSLVLVLALPVMASAAAVRGIDRPNGRRIVMISMIVCAVAVLFSGLVFAMPVVVALGIAHFQLRKAEMKEQLAAGGGAPATDDVIDVDEVDPDEGDVDDAAPDDDQRND